MPSLSKTEPSEQKNSGEQPALVPTEYLYPFVLVTTLFALWGFANNYTDPLVRAFKEIFLISNVESSWVQSAFYGGYATMAIPAALVIRKYSFKTGIIIGLILYAIGALLTIPASMMMTFWMFLVSFYVLTFGLAFLETAANPYILSMGPEETATRRLNLAQAFNPVGTLAGGMVAAQLILPSLQIAEFRADEMASHPEYAEMLPGEVDGQITTALEAFRDTEPENHEALQLHDLEVLRFPYVVIALVVIGVLIAFLISKMPDSGQAAEKVHLSEVLSRLTTFRFLGGVLAQGLYVGAQIMTWTFTIHYGMTLLKLSAAEAQQYNVIATIVFLVSRFVWTYVLRYVNAGTLLASLAAAGIAMCLGAVFIQGLTGMYCLIGVSACFGVMFPTIYGIALDGLSVEDAKLGSAGLIFAIVGGALMPPLQGRIIDGEGMQLAGQALESVRVSYLLPAACLVFVVIYGLIMSRRPGVKAS